VAAALAQATDALMVVVASDTDRAGWLPDARTVHDVRADAGALGAIHAALVHADAPVIAVAWDMPGVTAPLLRDLRGLGGGGVDAVVPWSDGPLGVEPACAWYGPGCIAAIERRLDAGDRRAGAWLSDVRVVTLSEARVRAHGEPRRLFANVNTPDDLAALERALASDAAAARG
jgi:molybdopterin-guanine dinucleotide biosynthesis protein A